MKWRLRTSWAEGLLALLIFATAAWWGTTYWGLSLKTGREPQFYQLYFEPAVMIACGHGFVISHPQPKPLEDFLWRRVNTFSCDQVAGQLDLSTKYLYQGAWRYLLYATGITWRFTGVAWSRLGPLLGTLFGLSILSIYGIFRLAMGRWASVAGAFVLAVSTLHLTNLPHLRDYSKAPFTLALILILGWIVKAKPVRTKIVLLAAAYGFVLGIGYGFRTDLLVDIPAIVITLFLFLDGGFSRNLITKCAAAAAFTVVFLATAWPILRFVSEKGGGQWHVMLLGMSPPFDESLRIEAAPYELVGLYQDVYVDKTAKGYAARTHPESRDAIFGTHEYDLTTRSYVGEIVSRFPGDLMTRALASSLQITELPFRWPTSPIDGLARWLYRPRLVLLRVLNGTGPLSVALAVAAVAAYNLRLGLFLSFFLLYFCGYPAIQFATRHLFHFEFVGVWAVALLITGAIHRPAGRPSVRRMIIWAGVTASVVAVPLIGLRIYQSRRARGMFSTYLTGPRNPISLDRIGASGLMRIAGPTAYGDVRFLEVDVNSAACGPRMVLRYKPTPPADDYSDTLTLPFDDALGPTRVFAPVYASNFQGLELPGAGSGCAVRAYWVDPDHRPLLLTVVMPSNWIRRRLYQRVSLSLLDWRL